jgi:hypothetical protein
MVFDDSLYRGTEKQDFEWISDIKAGSNHKVSSEQ